MSLKHVVPAIVLASGLAAAASAQIGYGVNANGNLFSFPLNNPTAPVTNIGNVGFVPEGIDFRPGSNTLYAIDIGSVTSQLYSINITTGASTPIGATFPSSVSGSYNLTTGTSFGFDVNPTTLQADNSIRIRLTSNTGTNLRLHSATGQVAAVDAALNPGTPSVDSVAYTNSGAATIGGTTSLYGIDYGSDSLVLINPPNNGTLTTVGSLGVSFDANANTSFDILSSGGIDSAYAVIRRPNAPVGGPFNQYLLYNINLTNGLATGGSLVGNGATSADFAGGFAVIVPSPSAATLGAAAGLTLARRRRR